MLRQAIYPWTLESVNDVVNAQNPDYPNRYFVPIKFDYAVRGAYNVSECLEELLTCWELIRPLYMCTQFRMKDSLCSNMREYCHDEHGDFPGKLNIKSSTPYQITIDVNIR
ncbi:unnamed protein product [Arctia plantaginis]|uniref:Uncharacterized protein n=1 Tax=Arctia plantaginis TaxID=874455 RepID=A0A8S1BQQ8_ARCPL|nr:unnamed protein product [Arctia plantaginis]